MDGPGRVGKRQGGKGRKKEKGKERKAKRKADRCKGGCEKEGNKIKGSNAAYIARAGKLRGGARRRWSKRLARERNERKKAEDATRRAKIYNKHLED